MAKRRVFLIRNVTGFGGGEVYQLNMARLLKASGFEPFIVTNSRELKLRAKRAGYNVLVPPYIRRQNWSGFFNILLPWYVIKLHRLRRWYRRVFSEYRPETVNIQSRDDYLAATKVAKKCGIRVLWTDHADFKNWVLWNLNVKMKNLIGKRIMKLSREAEKVIFVGDRIYKETAKMILPYRFQNAVVIRSGVFDERSEYAGIEPAGQSFVFIGRVVEEKGVRELIEAFDMVRRNFSEAVLNVYGAGEIKEFQNGKKSAGVVFHGKTDEPLMALAENGVFVLPSHKEGLSLSLLEAAMMGKTIIATNVDGNPEVVEDGVSGILVPAGDVGRLAMAMEKVLLDLGLAQKLARGARERYEQEFGFERIFAEKMLLLYNGKKENA